MYAFIRRYRMHKGTIDELMASVEQQFADQITGGGDRASVKVPEGIVGYQAIDTGDRTIVTVTRFATEEHWRAARRGADAIRLSLADYEVEELDTFGGPVMISREPK